jgi:tRNA nucleotidyltransferase (CCA-adding enzyme)
MSDMRNPFKKDNRLTKVINELTEAMNNVEPDSEEYNRMAQNLEILVRAKSSIKETKIDWNTVLMIGGTILQTVLILKHEKVDIITTKAMSTLLKLRV